MEDEQGNRVLGYWLGAGGAAPDPEPEPDPDPDADPVPDPEPIPDPDPALGPPDYTRAVDIPPDFTHQGLLATISEEDVKDTGIFIYRESSDQLITSREKLSEHEVIPDFGTNQYRGRISYHMLIRCGLSLYGERQWLPRWTFEKFQDATKVNEELLGVEADHLRIGEWVKVIIINRATGYMGSGRGVVGFVQKDEAIAGKDVQNDQISVLIPPITLGPPNLKIKNERAWKVERGLTADESRENIIGYEGAGLTSDQYIQVTTEWFDHDGSALPEDLPGYTGRLASVVGTDTLAAVSSSVENFEIKPGVHTEVLSLPGEYLDDGHFYIHVVGEQPDGNPDFSEIGAAPSGPLKYRPKHYTPFLVPLFDEAATLAAAKARTDALRADWLPGDDLPVLEEIEKIYRWVFRPEMQFSLYDFAIDEFDLLTAWDSSGERSETTVGFQYDLYQDPDWDPLDPLGPERQLVLGLGYGEILAVLDDDQRAEFPSVHELQAMTVSRQYLYMRKALDSLTPGDYLGLQLYQNSDAGNPLTEIMGLPLLLADSRPVKIMRQHHPGKFNNDISGHVGTGYTDAYGRLSFNIISEAEVTARFLDATALLRDVDKNLARSWRKKLGFGPGNAQALFHAEGHSLMRAYKRFSGNLPLKMTLYVDRMTCPFCRTNLPDLVDAMGIEELTIITKSGKTGRISSGAFEWME